MSEDSVSTRVGHMIKTKVSWQFVSDRYVFFGNGERICFCMFYQLHNTHQQQNFNFQVCSKSYSMFTDCVTCVVLSLQGALAVSFSIFGTSFLFIDSHFTCKFSFFNLLRLNYKNR